ncbi:BTB and MATH domain-containing protein 42-like [Daphnia pulicaria]|jgi:speckle-type POZ protein|uniref:BTB and MATH domain-containing protein 42-like n=1 Tax=Daphnia pulicaria TaxID=35523 RepID=UPI001EEC355B|nr:BTB and MATH domain-containing protein 42-like [Daphnia pulicaria]
MANSSKVKAREIRSGLFNIRWEITEKIKEKSFCCDYFTLNVLKSSLTFDMIFENSLTPIKNFAIKNVSQEELKSESEKESVNKDESEDNADEDDNGNDHADEGETEPKQKIDKSSFHPLKTEICPMHMWIYTFESATGMEHKLLKNATDEWRVEWISYKLPDFINLWIDFGTQSPIERNVIKTMSGLASMFYDQHRCDVQFRFKDGKSIGAHILILSIGSPVFSAMFQSGLLESQTREVTITDIELEIFRQLLDYLYTGSAPKLADENITKLLFEAADKYSVEHLKNDCLEALQERVRLHNVVNLLIWSHFRSTKPLFDMALDFIVNNFRKLFVQADFEDFLKNYPDLCLMVMKRVALLPCQCDPDEIYKRGNNPSQSFVRPLQARLTVVPNLSRSTRSVYVCLLDHSE